MGAWVLGGNVRSSCSYKGGLGRSMLYSAQTSCRVTIIQGQAMDGTKATCTVRARDVHNKDVQDDTPSRHQTTLCFFKGFPRSILPSSCLQLLACCTLVC